MKKILIIMALFIASSVYANEMTTNFNLEIPSTGTRDWTSIISKDIISIDTVMGIISSDSSSKNITINILSSDAVIQDTKLTILSNDAVIQNLNTTIISNDVGVLKILSPIISSDVGVLKTKTTIISNDIAYYPIRIISHDIQIISTDTTRHKISLDIVSDDVSFLRYYKLPRSAPTGNAVISYDGATLAWMPTYSASGVSYPISVANGGTGSAVGYTVVSNDVSDLKLKTTIISNDVGVLKSGGGTLSNVIFEWHGVVSGDNASNGLITGNTSLVNMASGTKGYQFVWNSTDTAVTMMMGRFTKSSGISTITIFGKLWTETAGTAELSVEVGGLTGTATSTNTDPVNHSLSFSTGTINVSSLTNGSDYTLYVKLRNQTNGKWAACCEVMLFAS